MRKCDGPTHRQTYRHFDLWTASAERADALKRLILCVKRNISMFLELRYIREMRREEKIKYYPTNHSVPSTALQKCIRDMRGNEEKKEKFCLLRWPSSRLC